MKKRVLSLLLVVAMLASLVVFPAYAADTDLCPCGCGETLGNIEWKPWTYPISVKEGQHYRLEEDLIIPSVFACGTSSNSNSFVLDLNGHTWRAESGNLMNIGSKTAVTVDIFDSVGGGELQAYGGNNGVGVIQVLNGATLNLHSGTIRQLYSATVVPRLGAVYVMHSNVNMFGGKITDGYTTSTAADSAGNVMVRGTSVFTMTGGEIVNGYATQYGGGVVVYSNDSQFIMSGGTISGNITEGNGGNVYVSTGSATFSGNAEVKNGVAGGKGGNMYFGGANGTVTLDSVTKVDGDIYVNREVILDGTVNIPMGNSNGVLVGEEGKVALGENFTTSSVVFAGLDLSGDGSGVISAAGAADYVGCFLPVGRTYGFVANEDTTITANCHNGIDASTDTTTKSYCPHCDQLVTWNRFSMKKPNTAGHYLANGSTTSFGISAGTNGEDIVVDMNGLTFRSASATMFTINNAVTGDVNISFVDTRGSGILIAGSTTAATHGGIVRSSQSNYTANIELWSGTLIGTSERGGAIGFYKGLFDMKGGIIKDSQATAQNGGAIWGYTDNADVTMSGGLISNCSAVGNSGGSIYVGGKLEITGGIIQGGTALQYGGNISIGTSAANTTKTHTISNAVIRKGTTTSTSNGSGGNIGFWFADKTLSVSDSTVAAGTSAVNGGNIGSINAYALSVENSVIYNGAANGTDSEMGHGGNIQFGVKDKTEYPVSITGSEIFGGTAKNGGNIYIQEANGITMTDCVIADGHASASSGNIYIRGNSTVDAANLTNVRIYNGTAGDPTVDTKVRTDNVFVATSIVLDNVVIKGSSDAQNYGSGLNLRQSAGTNAVVATLKNNTVIGNVNDPFDASMAVETGTGVGSLVVDASFRGSVVLSPQGLFGYTDGVTNLTRDLPYGTALVNASCNGEFTGKLYLGDHKTEELAVWTYGMPAITRNGDTLVVDEAGAIVNGKHYDLTTALGMTKDKNAVLEPVVTDLTLEDGTYYIDVNGRNVNVSGGATVYGIDSATDDHANAGTGTLVAADGVTVKAAATNPVTGDVYVRTVDTEKYEFHHIDMDITSVVLRTANAGVYYKGTWACDTDLAEHIAKQGDKILYGVVASIDDMPENGFDTDIDDAGDNLNCWSYASGTAFLETKVVNGALITGIMKESYDAAVNTNNAGIPIYAKAYLMVTEDDGSESYIVGKTSANKSLMDMLVKIDESLTNNTGDLVYQGNITTLMNDFYNTWKDLGLQAAIDAQEHVFTQVCCTPAVSDESTEA